MANLSGLVFVSLLSFSLLCVFADTDLPCAERDVQIEGRSIVCVCNSTYCDTITRVAPEPGSYVVYTSSNAGQRFEKGFAVIQPIPAGDTNDNEDEDDDGEIEEDIESETYEDTESTTTNVTVRLFLNRRFQFIEGFGGSVTDAAAINWRKLSDQTQQRFINSYFSSEGLEYNLIRVPIAGADFSTHPYTYNEYPRNDPALSNYTLAHEDLFYKLPMIKRSQRASTDEIKVTASTWSAPVWMKTNERITGFGQLRPEYYQAYADYHLRFIEEYSKAEVKIWAITTTNEPINGIVPLVSFNSMGWLPSQMARWLVNNLGPTIKNSRFNDTLILAVDDQRYILPFYISGIQREDPKAFDYIDGFAIHYYGNFVPAGILANIQGRFPNKILLSTEACEGPMPWDSEKVSIGSWDRARKYARSILQDLNNYVVGWIDWNLCLDPQGGPNWAENFVDAPILVYGDADEFIKQPMFYAMGHFSKFIPRGSRRIRVARRSWATVQNLAVITPSGNVVMVLLNARQTPVRMTIRISSSRQIILNLEPESLKTIEFTP